MDFKPRSCGVVRRTAIRSQHSQWAELQNVAGALHDESELKVVEIADSGEGRLTQLEVKNDRRLWQATRRIACTKGEANNYVCNPEDQDSQRGNKWSVTLIRGHTFSEPRVG